MLDSLVKAPIIGLYIAFIPLLWCFAVHALNHACIADEWLYKVCYCFFAFSEMCCSFAMMYSNIGFLEIFRDGRLVFYEKYDCYC